MTKMEMIERFYGRSEELEKKFDAAEKVGDAQTMQACRDAYQELVKEVRAEGGSLWGHDAALQRHEKAW